MPPGSFVIVKPEGKEQIVESLNRWVAAVTLPDGRVLADELIQAGHGVAFMADGHRPASGHAWDVWKPGELPADGSKEQQSGPHA